jgi:hypothetical protein
MGVLDVLAAPFKAIGNAYQDSLYGQGWQQRAEQDAEDRQRAIEQQTVAQKLQAAQADMAQKQAQQALLSTVAGSAAASATTNPNTAATTPLAASTDQTGPVAPKYDIPESALAMLPQGQRQQGLQMAENTKSDADAAEAVKQAAQDRADAIAAQTAKHQTATENYQAQMLALANRKEASKEEHPKPDNAVPIPGYVNADGSPLFLTHAQINAAASGGAGVGGAKQKVTGQAASRVAGAAVAQDLEKHIGGLLDDPGTAAQLGPYEGRKVGLEEWYGNPDPKIQQLLGSIEGYAMNNQGVHGMRNSQAAKEAVEKMFGPKFSAEDIKAAVHGYGGASRSLLKNFGPQMGLGESKPRRTGATKSGTQYTVED